MPKPTKPTTLNYRRPPGFSVATVSLPPASDLANIFSQSNLISKQIWHLTLPASVPIHGIKKLSMASILRGDTVVSHNDTDYNFVPGPKGEQISKHVLLPDEEYDDYRAAPMPISRTLHLQQILRLPELIKSSMDEEEGTQTPSEPRKAVHEQPAGLKMRYRPFGDESPQPERTAMKTNTGSGEDSRSNVAKFRVPPGLETMQRKEKRKLENRMASDDTTLGSPSKKRHKKRHIEQDAEPVAKTQVNEDEHTATNINADGQGTVEDAATNGGEKKHHEETSDEKAKRKAEKRKRRKERRHEDVLEEPTVNGAQVKRKPEEVRQDEDILKHPVTEGSQERDSKGETDAKANRRAERKKRKGKSHHADDVEDSATNGNEQEYKGKLIEERTERGAEKSTRREDTKDFPAVNGTGSKHDSETSEERAKLRAEKKRRKAEKEKRAQARDDGS